MLVIGSAARHRRGQQMFRQNHARAQTWPVRAIIALPYAIETVARSHYPGVRGRPLQIFAKILENGGVFRRQRSKIVDRLVDPGSQAGRSDVVPQNPAIHHLRKKSRLRNQLPHQVRNILLPLRRKRLLIPRPAPKRDDDNLLLLAGNSRQCSASSHSDAARQQRATQRHRRASPQELPPAPSKLPAKFLRKGAFRSSRCCHSELARRRWAQRSKIPTSSEGTCFSLNHDTCSECEEKYDAPVPKSSEPRFAFSPIFASLRI